MPPNRLLLSALAPLLFSLVMTTPVGATNPEAWPSWSRPQEVATGNRHYGFQSAMFADGRIVVATVNRAADALQITELGKGKQFDIPVTNLVSYAVCSFGTEAAVVWSERLGNVSALWLQLGTNPKVLLTKGEQFITDVTVSSDSNGRLFVAWAGGVSAAEGIYLSLVEAAGANVREPLQLTFGNAQDRSPTLFVLNDALYLTFKRDRVLFTEVHYKPLSLDSPQDTSSVIIGSTSRESRNSPLLSISMDDSVDVFWLQSALLRGQERGSTLVKGQITAEGQWLVPLSPLLAQEGNNLSLALTESAAGVRVLTWLSDASSSFQAYYLALDAMDNILEHGPVTRTHGNKFGTQIHENEMRHVLFYELNDDELAVMYVDDRHVEPVPFAVSLGLDPEMPLLDAFYTLVSTAAAALAITLLASLLIIPLVLLLGRLAPIRPAHFPLFVALFNIILRFVARPYLGQVLVPSWVGMAIMLMAVIFAYAVLHIGKLDSREPLTLGAFALCYAFNLFFFSLMTRTVYLPRDYSTPWSLAIDLTIAICALAVLCYRRWGKTRARHY